MKEARLFDLSGIVRRHPRPITTIVGMSALMNGLVLSGSIYMMLVYDVVIPSHNANSLWGLLAILIVMYAFQGGMDFLRGRLMGQLARTLHDEAEPLIVELHHRAALARRSEDPIADLARIRSYLSSSGPTALIDMPWMALFLGVLFLFHPLLGTTAAAGALVMMAIAWISERTVARETRDATLPANAVASAVSSSRRHAEIIRVLGMKERVRTSWHETSRINQDAQQALSSTTAAMGGITRSLRMLLQSVMLTVGALLVIDGRATGGVIFASSIITSRALAPVDLAIANWRGFESARSSWKRLISSLLAAPETDRLLPLPAASMNLSVEGLRISMEGRAKPVIEGVSFRLNAGEACAVIGASASGKTSLLRALVGAISPSNGEIRIDDATIDQRTTEDLGRSIGYLPQDVQLLGSTISSVIARLDPEPQANDVIEASQEAGIHEVVLRMPSGYSTTVGTDGTNLSAGQRQRIGLARALYGKPFLIVLDEPNSNLDPEGEAALAAAIGTARTRGAIVVVAAHRQSVLSSVSHVLLLQNGRQIMFGPRDMVMKRITEETAKQRMGGV